MWFIKIYSWYNVSKYSHGNFKFRIELPEGELLVLNWIIIKIDEEDFHVPILAV